MLECAGLVSCGSRPVLDRVLDDRWRETATLHLIKGMTGEVASADRRWCIRSRRNCQRCTSSAHRC